MRGEEPAMTLICRFNHYTWPLIAAHPPPPPRRRSARCFGLYLLDCHQTSPSGSVLSLFIVQLNSEGNAPSSKAS